MKIRTLTKSIRETVLKEYDNRCALCDKTPQIHHIDEDPTNNELLNLIPLCPNHHISGQHNPNRKIEIPKLQLFRKYKKPEILLPQFGPIYTRQLFLETIEPGEEATTEIKSKVKDLINLVESMEKGKFYSGELTKLIGPINRMSVERMWGAESKQEEERRSSNRDYRKKLIENRESAQKLLIEMIDYQNWQKN